MGGREASSVRARFLRNSPRVVTVGERAGERKRVIVIGAGIAGLVAAYELKQQGHEPLGLERRTASATGSTR